MLFASWLTKAWPDRVVSGSKVTLPEKRKKNRIIVYVGMSKLSLYSIDFAVNLITFFFRNNMNPSAGNQYFPWN